MKETTLSKGLTNVDVDAAVQQLYDHMTKSSAQSDPDYEFVHDMVNKSTDGVPFSGAELVRISMVYGRKFGG